MTNAIIVTVKSISTPRAWDRSGPRMANPSNCVAVNVRLKRAFAAVSWSRGTRAGIEAPWAGMKNWPTAPKRKSQDHEADGSVGLSDMVVVNCLADAQQQ